MRFFFILLFTIAINLLNAQPLTDGMAVITHSSVNSSYASFSIFQTHNNVAAPLGSNWNTNFYIPNSNIYNQWKQIGTVFGVAIDNEKNIYLSASAISFNDNTIGPAGYAGVYKVDKDDWSISNFIETGNNTNEIPNSGLGIGNICFNKFHNQLLLTNLEDGKIYRYDLDGNLLSTFDPFQDDDGSTGFAGYGDGIWAINIFGNDPTNTKVYFSRIVESIQSQSSESCSIWYVELDENGEFSGDEVYCFSLPSGTPNTVTDLILDAEMNMYLAERAQNDFILGSGYQTHSSRAFRYEYVNQNWNLAEQYYVGTYNSGDNSVGGVALGDKNLDGSIECQEYAWFTGDYLTNSGDYGAIGIPQNSGNTINNSLIVGVNNGSSGYPLSKGYYGDIEIFIEPKETNIIVDSVINKCISSPIQLNVSGASSYSWSPPDDLDNSYIFNPTTTTINDVTYTVIGELCFGISDTATTTVKVINSMPDTLDVEYSNYNGFNTSCFDSNDGWISLDSALLNYTINWYDGSNDINIDNLNSGIYTVEVTDTFGCYYNLSMEISSPNPLNTILESSDYNSFGVSCYNYDDGYILSTTSGGIEPYSYNWTNSTETTQNIFGITSGNYTLDVIDLNGCETNDDIYLSQPLPLMSQEVVSNYKGYNISCHDSNDGFIDVNILGGVEPYTYQWSNGNTTTLNEGLSSGVYYLQVIDENNCPYFESFNLNSPSEIVTSIESLNNYNGFDISCYNSNDGEINILITGGNPTYTFDWSSGHQTDYINGLSAGQYNVQITDLNGCVKLDSILLQEPEPLSSSIISNFNFNGYDISCNGASDGSINFDLSGGVQPYNFIWSNGFNIEDLTNLSANKYIVTAIDQNNCSIMDSILLNEPPPLSLNGNTSNYNGYNISCFEYNDGWINVDATGSVPPYNFYWSNSENTEDINSLIAGNYSLNVIDDNSCESSISFNLNQPTVLFSEINSLNSYNGYDISCHGFQDGAISVSIFGSVPPYNFTWNTGENTDVISNLSANEYNISIVDFNNCFIENSITLNEPSPLNSSLSSIYDYNGYDISCTNYSDGAIDLSILGGVEPYQYSWSNGETTEDISEITSGSYVVNIVDANNCTNSNQLNLNQPTPLQLTLESSNYNGFNLSCFQSGDGYINSNVSGSVNPYNYQWSNGNESANINSLDAGNYSLTIIDDNNCVITNNIILTEPNDFFVTLDYSNDTCSKAVANGSIFITPEFNDYTINWSNGEVLPNVNNLLAGQNEVTVTDPYNCSKTLNFNVGNLDPPTADFTTNPNSDSLFYRSNSIIDFQDQSFDNWSTIHKWLWDFGNGFSDTIPNTSFFFESPGNYNVLLKVENIHGCIDTIQKTFRIRDFIIHIPNTFTPQGDDINDFFIAKGIGIVDIQMNIFDRWGEKIYSDYNQVGWSGVYQKTNLKCPEGVYIYDIYIEDIFGDFHRYIGNVSLLE